MEQKSIHIVLTEGEYTGQGKLVGIVDKEVIDQLNKIVIDNEKLYKEAQKLTAKNAQALRQANKLMRRIIDSHGISYDETNEAVGVSLDDVLYIGPRDRVTQDPSANPQDGDKVVGKLTKYERRKYDELVKYYEFLYEKAQYHNGLVAINESKLKQFELKILEGQEYDIENQYLIVSATTGKVYLYDKTK